MRLPMLAATTTNQTTYFIREIVHKFTRDANLFSSLRYINYVYRAFLQTPPSIVHTFLPRSCSLLIQIMNSVYVLAIALLCIFRNIVLQSQGTGSSIAPNIAFSMAINAPPVDLRDKSLSKDLQLDALVLDSLQTEFRSITNGADENAPTYHNEIPVSPRSLVPPSITIPVKDDVLLGLWKETLHQYLQEQTSAVKEQIHVTQTDFDECSIYIRGDTTWRKQIASYHDKLNDVLQLQLGELTHTLKTHVDALSQRLADSLEQHEAKATQEVKRVGEIYEDKLRRTRTSLKKEMDRFARLEHCLRKEEAHQAKQVYEQLVQELKGEHTAKEAALHALLREWKSSYTAMESTQTQLLEEIQRFRTENTHLKQMLKNCSTGSSGTNSPTRKSSSIGGASGSPSRKSAGATAPANATVWGAQGSTAGLVVTDAYVQSLKQALKTATDQVDRLKKQLDEASCDSDALTKKCRLSDAVVQRTASELVHATQLLSESHVALLQNQAALAKLEQENAHWKSCFDELEFKSGSHDKELENARRLTESMETYVTSMERRVQRLLSVQLRANRLQSGFTLWQQSENASELQLKDLVSAFVLALDQGADSVAELERDHRDMELKLRYEFEKKYSEHLNLRISHERKRVITRIDMLCTKQAAIEYPAKQNRRANRAASRSTSVTTSCDLIIPRKRIRQIVIDSYDDLGFMDWAKTDLDAIHTQMSDLLVKSVKRDQRISELETEKTAQGLALAKADLMQQEKDYLLAKLTQKYRHLRDAWETSPESPDLTLHLETQLVQAEPLTVYGHPQPLERKMLPRARPVSATCLSTSTGTPLKAASSCKRAASSAYYGSGGRVQAMRAAMPSAVAIPDRQNSQEPPDLNANQHVRSLLKSQFLQQLTQLPQNQLEDGGQLGPDGVSLSTPCTS